MGCLGFRMFCKCYVRDVGCWACGMFGMWYVRMWDARDVGCEMWDVCQDVGCCFTKCALNVCNKVLVNGLISS